MKNITLGVLLAVAGLSCMAWGADKKETVKVGDPIPALKASNELDQEVDLNAYKGKSGLVIFFFPKADTPG